MAFETIYNRVSDEVARNATITIETGTDPGDANYGPASLVDGNPAKVAKIDDTTGAWLFAYDDPQPIQIAALIHHDFDAGADVKLQGNATDSWGSPSFEADFVIPDWFGSGTTRWPVNPWLDLTQEGDYDPAGFAFWRLVITGNSQNLQLGEVWFGSTIRRLSPDVRWEYVPLTTKRIIDNRTAFDVSTIYSRGTTHWRMEAEIRKDDALEADLEAHWYDVDGRSYLWLLIPQPPGATTDIMPGRANRAYLVRYAGMDRSTPHVSFNLHDQRITVEEVSRGLRPGL